MKTVIPAIIALALCAPTSVAPAVGEGFGTYRFEPSGPCVNDAELRAIAETVRANESMLRAEGRITDTSALTAGAAPEAPSGLLHWPVALAPGIDDYDCWAIVTLVDHDYSTGSVLDYNCGDRTYDLPTGYNHSGVDFLAWPFPWIKTDNDQMYAVAAQAGIIVGKTDGSPDHNCSLDTGETANNVVVRHDDGSWAMYYHLKSGSLTSKQIGESVETGEYIGVVGSSGRSPVPHLHFEIHDRNGNLIDPFVGLCNDFNSTSWWSTQTPYRTPGINTVSTHSQPVEFPPCPEEEIPHFQNSFHPGEAVYCYAFGHDLVNGMNLTFRLIRPDGVLYKTHTYTASTGDYDSFYYWYSETVPSGHDGTWTVEVEFDGATYSHPFEVGVLTAVTLSSIDASLAQNYPNPFNPTTTIEYTLSVDADVILSVYDVSGRRLADLVNGRTGAGNHSVVWDGRGPGGNPVASGTYFYRLTVDGTPQTRKMILLK